MLDLRTEIKMMSVNQMNIYHTVMEVFNIIHNGSSELINEKYSHQNFRHSLRKNANNFVRVPEQPQRKYCTGFTNTVGQKYLTAFQTTSWKHRTEPHLRNW